MGETRSNENGEQGRFLPETGGSGFRMVWGPSETKELREGPIRQEEMRENRRQVGDNGLPCSGLDEPPEARNSLG